MSEEAPKPAGPPPPGDGRPLEPPARAAAFNPEAPAWMGHVPSADEVELAADVDNDDLPEWMRWVTPTPLPVDLIEAVEAADPAAQRATP